MPRTAVPGATVPGATPAAPGSRHLKRTVVPALSLLILTCLAACSRERAPTPSTTASTNAPPPGAWFVDRAEETGLAFTHVNGMSGKFSYAEIIGSGVALFDYDKDGDLDVFLVQGGALEKTQAHSTSSQTAVRPQGSRLFRNDVTMNADGSRALHFTDVTESSGIKTVGYGMGVAAADFNNDGCVDLYVTALGPNQLWRNNCDGTFTDVTRRAFPGAAKAASTSPQSGESPSWSVSAAFFDFDHDGWLDLFVGHYLDYSVSGDTKCFSASGRPDYCSPNVYRPQPSHLFHNNGDGTFSDVTAAAGMAAEFGPALGVATADFNGDGWMDLYVTNDGRPNHLWINQHNGTFVNSGLLSGSAMSAHGKAKAGMGVDAGDFDNDGDDDLVVANLRGEGMDLYVNDGTGLFEEQGGRAGLGVASQPYTGFGAAWLDFDNDGWLDVLIVNGAVQTLEALRQANDPFPLHQPKLLFRNRGNRTFEDVTGAAGEAFRLSDVSRGAAFGDIDNDGDVDVVVANNNGKARLLINDVGQRNHWVGLRVVGKHGSDLLGARVGVTREDGVTIWRRARSDGSYASANDPRVLAGLGHSSKPVDVNVTWPDGKTEEWSAVPVDRYTTLVEGSGK